MRIIQAGVAAVPAITREDTFSGEVWMDAIMPATEGIALNHVTFHPSARTFWHHHEHGQLLRIVTGTGLICARGAQPTLIRAGDLVWTSPGEEHWHGACANTLMSHLAVSLGTTSWLEEVSDSAYRSAGKTG